MEVGSYPEDSIVGDSKDTKESTVRVRRRKITITIIITIIIIIIIIMKLI